MSYHLAHIILAARRNDDDQTGWMQILVIVVLAVFYALGGILKARSKKLTDEQDNQSKPKPPLKPPQSVRGRRTQLVQPSPPQPPRRMIVRPEPAAKKMPTPRAEQPPAKPLRHLELRHVDISPKARGTDRVIEPYFHFEDPENLKRAILHYEILGKPLSLRHPDQGI